MVLAVFIGYPRGIGTDGAFYALSGYNLFHGNGFTYSNVPNTFTWPLFSILIGLVNLVVDDLQVCAHMVLTLAFAAGVYPLYYAVRNFFDEKIAMTAAILYVMNGFLLKLSARMIPESLLVLMILMSVYYASKILRSLQLDERANKKDYLGAGGFLGFGYLVKPEAFQYFVITFIFLAVLIYARKKFLQEALGLWVIFFVFSIVVAPQLSFVHEVTGKWELTTYNRFLFRGAVEPLVSLRPGEAATDPKMEYNYHAYNVRGKYTAKQFRNDINLFPAHFLKYSRSLLTVIGPIALILLIFFIFTNDQTHRTAKRFILFMLLPMATMILWYSPADRLFIVSVPFFIMISAYFLSRVRDRFQNKPYLFYALLLAVIIQSFTPIANQSPTNSVIGNHRKMGDWVRDNVPDISGKLLADRKPYISFFARARYFRYNNAPDYPSLIKQLKNNRVDYLVVDDFYTRTKNPGVIELLDGKDWPDLKFVHAVEDSSWGKAILYKIRYK